MECGGLAAAFVYRGRNRERANSRFRAREFESGG
jgi:hypothetical protein